MRPGPVYCAEFRGNAQLFDRGSGISALIRAYLAEQDLRASGGIVVERGVAAAGQGEVAGAGQPLAGAAALCRVGEQDVAAAPGDRDGDAAQAPAVLEAGAIERRQRGVESRGVDRALGG